MYYPCFHQLVVVDMARTCKPTGNYVPVRLETREFVLAFGLLVSDKMVQRQGKEKV